MSTELKPCGRFQLTRFSGGRERGVCLQVTATNPDATQPAWLQMTKAEAAELAAHLQAFVTDTSKELF